MLASTQDARKEVLDKLIRGNQHTSMLLFKSVMNQKELRGQIPLNY